MTCAVWPINSMGRRLPARYQVCALSAYLPCGCKIIFNSHPIFRINDVVKWASWVPAQQVGLANRKGKIAPGFDADLVIWNPDEKFTVRQC